MLGSVKVRLWLVSQKIVAGVRQGPCESSRTGTVYADDQSRNDLKVGQRSIKPVTQGASSEVNVSLTYWTLTYSSWGSIIQLRVA